MILITGANGFVGSALLSELIAGGRSVRATVRGLGSLSPGVNTWTIGNIGPDTRWGEALVDVEAVVHLAARVHVMDENATDPLAAFREVNVLGTERLARAAAAAGVRRFVHVSSVKVNGEATLTEPFRESAPPAPEDAYSLSKWEAEQVLFRVATETGLEVVILRPPLVYGPGVGANFLRLIRMAARGWPLPLSSVSNLRSMLYVGNLCSAIRVCLEHPAAAGQTFLVSDSEDISTPDLIRRLAQLLGGSDRLWPLPLPILRALAILAGKSAEIARLTGSLRIDNSRICHLLGWQPPFTLDQGLAKTAAWFLASRDMKQ